jgi:ribosomal protein S12 methylthiotransferase
MKIGFVSLGCPKNLVDSEVMLGLARDAGHEITPDARDAEVLVVNTCAFIDSAKQESVDAILEMAQHKQAGGCRRLVVTGCLAERYRDELRAEIPEIDAVLGTGEVPEIVSAIEGNRRSGVMPVMLFRKDEVVSGFSRTNGENAAKVRLKADATLFRARQAADALPTYIYDATTPRVLTTPRHFAYVKAAEGCDYTCAFCIIPALRGKYRSRAAASIVDEARALADRGVRELILISQDTTFYGIDLGERGALARLLRDLDTVEGLKWIRLLYLYPTTIGDDTLDAMADCEKVCKYVDLPLQHASPAVLRRMKRPGNRQIYTRLLDRIRDRVPGVALRTTFIVGFPGETDADIDELCGFVRDVRFDHVGVFTYSHEEGTSAHGFVDDVPAADKRKRRGRVMGLQKRVVARAQRDRLGQRVRLMIDGPSAEHELVLRGRLEGQAPDIDPVVYLTDCDATSFEAGQLIEAEVTGSRGYDLIARPLP